MKLKSGTIIGSVIGDIIGSVYEWNNTNTTDFNIFNVKCDYTDDTVLTIAVADCILNKKDFSKTIWEYGRKYPNRGYGEKFNMWLRNENRLPYNSYGNGSGMRVSPVGFAYDTINDVLKYAKKSAEISHNHEEGIKGAQAIASAVYLAKIGNSKNEIKKFILKKFKYNLNFSLDEIRNTYEFDESCQGSVPQAIVAFLESKDFENAIRLAISIGGDSDTIACMTGGIAAAFYKEIPDKLIEFAYNKIPDEFKNIIYSFEKKYNK